MRCMTLVLVNFAALVVVSNTLAVPKCLTGKLLQMDSCDGYYKMGYKNITINKVDDNKYMVDGGVEVMETVEGPVNVTLTVFKCDEKFKKGSCTIYTTWTTEGCKEMREKKGTLYKMIESAGGKEEHCPLHPSTYMLKNYEIKIPESTANLAATQGHVWYVSIAGTAQANEVVLCTNVWLEIVDCEEPQRKYSKFRR